jgi:hypothetical protein
MFETITEEVLGDLTTKVRREIQSALISAQHQGFERGERKGRDHTAIDADAARNELREVKASFERGDMGDVRLRLMDLANILDDGNFWIPSR